MLTDTCKASSKSCRLKPISFRQQIQHWQRQDKASTLPFGLNFDLEGIDSHPKVVFLPAW